MKLCRRLRYLLAISSIYLFGGSALAAPASPQSVAESFLTATQQSQREALMTSSFRAQSQFFPPPARDGAFFAKVSLKATAAIAPKKPQTSLVYKGTGTHKRYKQPLQVAVYLQREGTSWKVDEVAIEVVRKKRRGWGALLGNRPVMIKKKMMRLRRSWGLKRFPKTNLRRVIRRPVPDVVMQLNYAGIKKKKYTFGVLVGLSRGRTPAVSRFNVGLRTDTLSSVGFSRSTRSTRFPKPYYAKLMIMRAYYRLKKAPPAKRVTIQLKPVFSKKAPQDCLSFNIDNKNKVNDFKQTKYGSMRAYKWVQFFSKVIDDVRYSNRKYSKTVNFLGKSAHFQIVKEKPCKEPPRKPGRFHFRRCRKKLAYYLMLFGDVPVGAMRQRGDRSEQFSFFINNKLRRYGKKAKFQFYRFDGKLYFLASVKSWPFGENPFKTARLCFASKELLARHTHVLALSIKAPASRPTSGKAPVVRRAVKAPAARTPAPRPAARKPVVRVAKAVPKKAVAPRRVAAKKHRFQSVIQQRAHAFLSATTNAARAAFTTPDVAAMLRRLPVSQTQGPLYREIAIKAEITKQADLQKVFAGQDTVGKVAIYGEGFVGASKKKMPFVLLFRRSAHFWMARSLRDVWQLEEAYLRSEDGKMLLLRKGLNKLFAWLSKMGFDGKRYTYKRFPRSFLYAFAPAAEFKPHNFAIMYQAVKFSSTYIYSRGTRYDWRTRRWTWKAPLPGYGTGRLKLKLYRYRAPKKYVPSSKVTLSMSVSPRFGKKQATKCLTLPRPAMNKAPTDYSKHSTSFLQFHEGGYYRADAINQRAWPGRKIVATPDINGKQLFLVAKTPPPKSPKKKAQFLMFGVSMPLSSLALNVGLRNHFRFYVNGRGDRPARTTALHYNGKAYFHLGWERSAFFGIRKEFKTFELCYFAPAFAARTRFGHKIEGVVFPWPAPAKKPAKPAARAAVPPAKRVVAPTARKAAKTTKGPAAPAKRPASPRKPTVRR